MSYRWVTAGRRLVLAAIGVVGVLVGVAVSPLAAHELRGTVTLVDDKGKPVSAGDDGAVIVYYEPKVPAKITQPAKPFAMVTKNKQFLPRVLAVPRGATVAFPNQDPILHNVFSLSPGNKFDLGLYRKGAGKSSKFERPGLVRVFCNVHHSMVGYVLVLDTPFMTTVDPNGRFLLDGPVPGAGTLTVWHERAESWSQAITVPATGPFAARLVVSKPRVPPHTNKLGKAYPRGQEY